MSDYASAVDIARRAFASVARLESSLARAPADASLQINLAAQRKLARQAEDRLLRMAELNHVEVCNYRLMPAADIPYALAHVSTSMLEFQNFFSQVYDALRYGKKQRATFGLDAASESRLEFGYSYAGSLGIILLAPSKRSFFEGQLDETIEAIFHILDISDADDVREIAAQFGRAVVKRVHDWSKSNLDGGFAADVQWNRSDGRLLGRVVERPKMASIRNLIVATSDSAQRDVSVSGILVAMDVKGGTFRLISEEGDSYRGKLHESFSREQGGHVPGRYSAVLLETRTTRYALEEPEQEWQLKTLAEVS